MYWRGDKSEFLQDCKEFLETNRMWSGRAEGVYVDFHELAYARGGSKCGLYFVPARLYKSSEPMKMWCII